MLQLRAQIYNYELLASLVGYIDVSQWLFIEAGFYNRYIIANAAETLASDPLGKERRPHDWTFGLQNIRACAHFEGNASDWIFLKFNAKFLIEEFLQKVTFHTSFLSLSSAHVKNELLNSKDNNDIVL